MGVIRALFTRPADKPGPPRFMGREQSFWAVHSLLIATSALVLVWFISSCKDVRPRAVREQIKDTRALLDEARRHDADRYAPNAMRLAQGAFHLAMVEVETQESRVVPLSSFERAKQQLGRARQAAYGAIFEAAAVREKARQDSLLLMDEAQKTLQPLLNMRLAPPRGDTSSDVEFENLANTLADAKWAYQSGDYLTARAKVEWFLLHVKELES